MDNTLQESIISNLEQTIVHLGEAMQQKDATISSLMKDPPATPLAGLSGTKPVHPVSLFQFSNQNSFNLSTTNVKSGGDNVFSFDEAHGTSKPTMVSALIQTKSNQSPSSTFGSSGFNNNQILSPSFGPIKEQRKILKPERPSCKDKVLLKTDAQLEVQPEKVLTPSLAQLTSTASSRNPEYTNKLFVHFKINQSKTIPDKELLKQSVEPLASRPSLCKPDNSKSLKNTSVQQPYKSQFTTTSSHKSGQSVGLSAARSNGVPREMPQDKKNPKSSSNTGFDFGIAAVMAGRKPDIVFQFGAGASTTASSKSGASPFAVLGAASSDPSLKNAAVNQSVKFGLK